MSEDKVLNEKENNAEASVEAEAAEQNPLEQRIAELETALAEAQAKAEENWDLALRAKAEAENAKRRAEKDVANAHKFAVEKFVNELLPIIDSIELGLAAVNDENADVAKFREGNELTLKMAQGLMEKFNIAQLDPEGEKFDPTKHQAMSMQEVEGVEANTVVNVVQKGYQMHDRVLRPAMVIVAKAVTPPAGDTKIDEMA